MLERLPVNHQRQRRSARESPSAKIFKATLSDPGRTAQDPPLVRDKGNPSRYCGYPSGPNLRVLSDDWGGAYSSEVQVAPKIRNQSPHGLGVDPGSLWPPRDA
jgi:hypothetical protein